MGKVRKTSHGYEVVHTYDTKAEVEAHMKSDAMRDADSGTPAQEISEHGHMPSTMEEVVEMPYPNEPMSEHQKILSRTTGRKMEISMGPHGGGLVPANPFASLAQAGYLHSHPEILGPKKLAEFDAATRGRKLPKHVKGK